MRAVDRKQRIYLEWPNVYCQLYAIQQNVNPDDDSTFVVSLSLRNMPVTIHIYDVLSLTFMNLAITQLYNFAHIHVHKKLYSVLTVQNTCCHGMR